MGLDAFTLLLLWLLLFGLVTFGMVGVEWTPVVGLVGKTPPGSVDCISTNSVNKSIERSIIIGE